VHLAGHLGKSRRKGNDFAERRGRRGADAWKRDRSHPAFAIEQACASGQNLLPATSSPSIFTTIKNTSEVSGMSKRITLSVQ